MGKERLASTVLCGRTEVFWENTVRGLNAVPSHVCMVPVTRPLASTGQSSGLPK